MTRETPSTHFESAMKPFPSANIGIRQPVSERARTLLAVSLVLAVLCMASTAVAQPRSDGSSGAVERVEAAYPAGRPA